MRVSLRIARTMLSVCVRKFVTFTFRIPPQCCLGRCVVLCKPYSKQQFRSSVLLTAAVARRASRRATASATARPSTDSSTRASSSRSRSRTPRTWACTASAAAPSPSCATTRRRRRRWSRRSRRLRAPCTATRPSTARCSCTRSCPTLSSSSSGACSGVLCCAASCMRSPCLDRVLAQAILLFHRHWFSAARAHGTTCVHCCAPACALGAPRLHPANSAQDTQNETEELTQHTPAVQVQGGEGHG